jgi:hypothetical protein
MSAYHSKCRHLTAALATGIAVGNTSALGQKQTSRSEITMSALPPKADIAERNRHVRFDRLASGKGLCCSFADGFSVQDVDWDTHPNFFLCEIIREIWVRSANLQSVIVFLTPQLNFYEDELFGWPASAATPVDGDPPCANSLLPLLSIHNSIAT